MYRTYRLHEALLEREAPLLAVTIAKVIIGSVVAIGCWLTIAAGLLLQLSQHFLMAAILTALECHQFVGFAVASITGAIAIMKPTAAKDTIG